MSSGFLLDTSILSLSAPGRQPVPSALIAEIGLTPANTYLSVITVMEIEQGIEKLRRKRETRPRAGFLETWLVETIDQFGGRVLIMDVACARVAGRLSDLAFAKGAHPGFSDIAIAATAKAHELTILTRNLRHFIPLEVPCLDPFEDR